MKRHIRLITLAVLLTSIAASQADITSGLVAHYPLNGNANDASGNLNHGSIVGAVAAVGLEGQPNSAYYFNGNAYIVAPHHAAIDGLATTMTLSAWIRIDVGISYQVYDYRHIISKGATYGYLMADYAMGLSNPDVNTPAGSLQLEISNSSNYGYRLGSGFKVTEGVWRHVVVIFASPTVKYYCDGVLVATTSSPTSIIRNSTQPLYIGCRYKDVANGLKGGFAGVIDEVRIYNRALSASDIQQLYSQGSIYINANKPVITANPQDAFGSIGSSTTFSVTATGPGTLYYQWWKDGSKLTGKTASTLSINSVTPTDSGAYSVVVSNVFGTVTSKSAQLRIPSTQLVNVNPTNADSSNIPNVSPGKDSLVFITHGWRKKVTGDSPDFPWVTNMATVISNKLVASGQTNWDVIGYNWATGVKSSFTILPDEALLNGYLRGFGIGLYLRTKEWSHIHLIGHSAGSALIQGIADGLIFSGKTVHMTFLDPFLGLFSGTLTGKLFYGKHADWSDSYFATDKATAEYFTGGKVYHAHNVEVTWLDPLKTPEPKYCADSNPSGVFMYKCGYSAAYSRHEWPHEFYLASITNGFPLYSNYGFSRSKEGGGWNDRTSYAVGNNPTNLNDLSESYVTPDMTMLIASPLQLSGLPKAINGNVTVSASSLSLVTASPAWASLGLMITNRVNAVIFEAAFTNASQSSGLLSVYWNTNQIGIVDERAAGTSLQTYTMALPAVEESGAHLLGFRIDPLTVTNSSIVITNIRTAWISTQGGEVSMSVDPIFHLPKLTLTGFPGAAYLVECSTNLVDWASVGVFSSTNTTMQYFDPAAVTDKNRFYRAKPW